MRFLCYNALNSGEGTPARIKELQNIVDGVTSTTANPEDLPILRIYYQEPLRRFANPDGIMKNGNGTPFT